ncbi:MAG: aspartyl protease family protein [Desulfobacterales bacterium]|nr:aspartyl protease family protein [Desulfobacterales bacterium]
MTGIVALSVAKYITSFRHVETPEPVGKYAYKENKAQVKDVTLPGNKLHSRRESGHRPRSQPQEESFRPDTREDKPLSGDESMGSPPLDQQKAESRRDRQGETYTAREWFEKGRVLDDESEAETECYHKAIELDPEFAPAYYCLGAIYCRQANYELAYQEFARFLKYASEADRQAYNIYVYCSPSDVERLSGEKVEGQASAEGVEKEIPPEDEKETAGPAGEETGQESSEEVMTVVRFLPVDGHIMVPVVLNAFLEARMLVDTGAGITVLSRELARRVQLEGEPGNSITLKTMSMDIQAQLATLDSIQVGNLIQNNLRVAIIDLPPGEERRFDGILGMDFMNKYKIQIDNENNRILLSPVTPQYPLTSHQ